MPGRSRRERDLPFDAHVHGQKTSHVTRVQWHDGHAALFCAETDRWSNFQADDAINGYLLDALEDGAIPPDRRPHTVDWSVFWGRVDTVNTVLRPIQLKEQKAMPIFENPNSRESQDFDILTTNLAVEFPNTVDNLAACLEQWLGCPVAQFDGTYQQAANQVRGQWKAAYEALHQGDSELDKTFGKKNARGLTDEVREGFFGWIRPEMEKAHIEDKWLEPLRDMIALRLSNGATDSFKELSPLTTLEAMKEAAPHVMHLFTPMTREGLNLFLKSHGDAKGDLVKAALAWKTGKTLSGISQYGYVLYEVQGILDEYLHRDPAQDSAANDNPEPSIGTAIRQDLIDTGRLDPDAPAEPLEPELAQFVYDEAPDDSQPEPAREIMLFDPNRALAQVKGTSDLINRMLKDNLLIESHKDEKGNEIDGDYGRIAGSKKPALFKSGAEKLCEAFGLVPEFILLPDSISDWKEGFFYFHYKCELRRIATGELVATANGSCNSREDKYGWRWVEKDKVPAKYDLATLDTRGGKISAFDFAVDEAKTDGDFAKPAEYWQLFKDAIAAGTAVKIDGGKNKAGKPMFKWQIDATLYRIPNNDIFSIVNTLDKMSQKRSLVAATLIGTAASRFFSQDLEDLPEYGTIAS